MKKALDAGKIYDRLKEWQGFESDTDLARFLGLKTPQVLHNWRSRNSIQLDLILAKFPKIPLNWLFRGTPYEGLEVAALRARAAAVEKSRK